MSACSFDAKRGHALAPLDGSNAASLAPHRPAVIWGLMCTRGIEGGYSRLFVAATGVPVLVPLKTKLALSVRSVQGDTMRSASLLFLGQYPGRALFRSAPSRDMLGGS